MILVSYDWSPGSARQARFRGTSDLYQKREAERLADRKESKPLGPFVGWDTEGTNETATPFLFGSSMGDSIEGNHLTSVEMFELVLAREAKTPNAIHVIYGGEYDFNMMLKDLPLKHLLALRDTHRTQWNDYTIEHIPRKWFYIRKGNVRAKIFDVISFFQCPYVKAITDNEIGSESERARIAEGKAGRSAFSYADIEYVRPYWQTELRLLPMLMDKVREAFYSAGMRIHSWHGPGSLARFALRHHKAKDVMNRELPMAISEAARYAFCGGRFEPFYAGLHEGPVYSADINSAYPYAASMLPNLQVGRWIHKPSVNREYIQFHSFALYRIRYSFTNRDRRSITLGPFPLFRRFEDDRVQWVNRVEGWYWGPEAFNVKDDPNAEFLEAWEYVSDGSRPFKWIADYYDIRTRLKAAKDQMQLPFKLLINSVYGQFAMRAGWQRYKGAPPYHQLEFAGYITSTCRAMIHRAALSAWDQNALISIDTDGIYSTRPFITDSLYNGVSDTELGKWKLEELDSMLFWQSGVYFSKDNGEWRMMKARGAPKGQIDYAKAAAAFPSFSDIKYTRSELRGYRWALRNNLSSWRYFQDNDRTIAFGGSPWSKRQHITRFCRACHDNRPNGLHDLAPSGIGFGNDIRSRMHVLPWGNNDHVKPVDELELKDELEIESYV